jgi:hypothetical protein
MYLYSAGVLLEGRDVFYFLLISKGREPDYYYYV